MGLDRGGASAGGWGVGGYSRSLGARGRLMKLLEEIEATNGAAPALWWLGESGFVVKSYDMVFYIDPCLSCQGAPLEAREITHADLILCTSTGASHMDPGTLNAMLSASRHARVVLPKSAAEHVRAIGVPYERMTTTDSDLRVEYFKR